MKMPKPTEADKQLFRSLVPEGARIRPMFGQLAGFINGNMFLCLFGDRIAVRLDPAQRSELLRENGAEPFVPMEGRPMKEYVVVPKDWSAERTEGWVDRALQFAAGLPPKK